MALATFLVLLALMMARLTAGRDPLVGTRIAQVVREAPGGQGVVTRTSTAAGGVPAPATAGAASGKGAGGGAGIATRTSGSSGAERDE
jgi:hypothetical protein